VEGEKGKKKTSPEKGTRPFPLRFQKEVVNVPYKEKLVSEGEQGVAQRHRGGGGKDKEGKNPNGRGRPMNI